MRPKENCVDKYKVTFQRSRMQVNVYIRELKQRTFLRSRTPTGSRWSNHVHTAHVMTFVWSRRRRQNATFQVEGRTPQNML